MKSLRGILSAHLRRLTHRPGLWRISILLVCCLLFLQACNVNIENLLPSIPGNTQAPAVGMTSVNTEVPAQAPTQPPTAAPSLTLTTMPTDTPAPLPTDTPTPAPTDTPASTQPSAPQPAVVFAVIGDYGSGQGQEGEIADMVISWEPEFIITVGDNNYPDGSASLIDEHIGKYYHSFIYPYQGSYGEGADENRFFPSLGNHDVIVENGKAYYDYFTLPGNERYYDFVWGPVHFFAINSMDSEPDGVNSTSVQAEWLKGGLEASTSPWNVVYFHYPPYSSGPHGSIDWMRWPFKDWGADIVLTGHHHAYERLEVDGFPYIINGLSGGAIYEFQNALPEDKVRYNDDWGAIRAEATEHAIKFEFITRTGQVIDTYEMNK